MNDEIIELINNGEKPMIVGLAGPGTGKSTAFKRIVDSDRYNGKKILILSFIRNLVNDLTNDFSEYKNVKVATLHSFALGEYKKSLKGGEINLTEGLDDVISDDHIVLNGVEFSYTEKICNLTMSQNEEEFYKARRNYYSDKNKLLYSFDSIIYAINKLYDQDESRITAEYDIILIDEFQDFNRLEYEFIKNLNKTTKILIVGDDDQSLYEWKFARPSLIRELYRHNNTDSFSLPNCYRCTKVIVDAVNSLITNAQAKGFLTERVNDKQYLYPSENNEKKHELSNAYPAIDFIPKVKGNQLIYQLSKRIKNDLLGYNLPAKVLVITPSYLKGNLYDGLQSKGYNVVKYELFHDETSNGVKHADTRQTFEVLCRRKTDNLMLRKVLCQYCDRNRINEIIHDGVTKNKKIWYLLSDEEKHNIEEDIRIYKKAKSGKESLNKIELNRLSELFCLKNLISRMIVGFGQVESGAQEVELATVMGSKGLSADFVYFVGIDDRNMTDKDTKDFTDQKICEFLVGITRAKVKLALFSIYDESPRVLNFLDSNLINTYKATKK
jgi:superfamily I DNA/RNA helicase